MTKLNASGSALVYSTYLGGSGSDFAQGVAVDTSGDAYVTGYTESSNFPTTAGAFQTTFGGSEDAFVTKLNATGSALIYSTYLGGSGYDTGLGIAVDAGGDAYVTGRTYSSKFPTTAGAFQTTSGGGPNAFVTKLNATGSALVYSTYLGGTNEDFGQGIAVDASGDAYVTGHTSSSNFPTTAGAFRTTEPGQINTFVTKLNASGSALVYSTYLGGNKVDVGTGITVDASGDAYVTGHTSSSNFPTSAGAFQTSLGGFQNAFVTKLNATGSALIYSTYLGGSGGDEGSGIAIDASDDAYVTGGTSSSNFPTTASAFQTSFGGGSRHAFVTKLNASGSALIYSTYLGGSGADFGKGIAIDASDDAYVTGYTESSNFPTTAGAFQTTSGGGSDAFVTKIVPTAATQTPPATLTVCESGPPTCEYATIQEAIDHIPPASNGATIQIAAGTYGGFVVSGGNVSLTSVTLEGAGAGKTTIRGGGPVVTIKSRAPVTITGVTISGGSNTGFGDRGGGILNSGTLTLTNSTVSGNTAYVGGGIFNSGTLTLTKSTVSENTAEDGSSGIANQGALTLTSSKVSSNTVTNASGGGISNGGTVTLTNSTVSGNTARHEAGGIFNFYGTVTLTNSTVSENTAKEEGGGGIYNEGGTETLTNSAVSGNTAGHQGGGIYGSGFGAVTLTNSAVSGNTACCSRGYLNPNGGGGIYNSSISTLTLTNSKVGDNSAALGGGIENEGSLGTVTLEDSKVSGNHANGGGGIFTYFGTLTLTNSSVSDNTAEGSGGGIDNVFGTPTLIRSHVSGNAAAEEGGGILNYRNEGTATLENSTVGDNSARSGSGIDNAYAGRMTLKNSVVSGNTAKEGGGGIHNGEEARMTLAKSTVSDNRAESGGGIYNAGHGFFTSGTLTLEKSSVSGNTAGARGGGIDDASGSPTLENSIVTGNRASEGGGVYSEGATTLKQTAVALNAATDGGGVFLNHGSTLALAQTVIVFNTATEKGGGIFNRGDVTGSHSAVFANIAKEGSGIFNEGGAVTLEESFVQP